MNKFILLLLDKIAILYKRSGIDYEQLRAIISVKLEINSRKTNGMLGQSTTGKQTSFTFGLVIYTIVGLLFALVIFFQNSALISFALLYAYIMVFIIMILITDFSSVLLDTSDNTIILPKPIQDKTVFAARNTFIIIYVSQIVLALSAGGIIFTFIKYGLVSGILFLVSLILITLFSTNLTYALYLGIMSFTSEETMKNTINYMQIVMTVVFMGSYQLLPRLIGNLEDVTQMLTFEDWMLTAPPFWYAALQTLVLKQTEANLTTVLAIALAIAFPFALQFGIQKYFIPFFNNKLQDLAIQNKKDEKDKIVKSKLSFDFSSSIKKLLRLRLIENSGYLLTIASLKGDRKLKLRIYPSIGYMAVFLIIILLNISRKNENWFVELNETYHYLWLIYFCGFLLNTATFETLHSENYKARWIYESTNLEKPGMLISGSFKANLIYFFIPAYILIGILILSIWGLKAFDDVFLGFFSCSLISLINTRLNQRFLPFSLPEEARTNGNNFARGLLMMLIVGVLSGLHYQLATIPYGITLAIIPFIILFWMMMNNIQNLSWKKITT